MERKAPRAALVVLVAPLLLVVVWGFLITSSYVGRLLGFRTFDYRMYLANDPNRPYHWHTVPQHGSDCQHRMMFTFDGETARSLRLGNLVLEVAQHEGMGDGPSVLDGPDCH